MVIRRITEGSFLKRSVAVDSGDEALESDDARRTGQSFYRHDRNGCRDFQSFVENPYNVSVTNVFREAWLGLKMGKLADL